MKVTVERQPEKSEAVLNVELEWAELEKASDRAYKKLAQRYTVPGFRKGHAPRSILERMVGKEAIYQEGLEDLIETTYRDAVRENDLTPLAQPELDAPPLEMGQPYTYTATVPVLEPAKLGDYKAVRVERPSAEVTDEDVEKVLEQVRQDQAMWLPAERPAQLGDKVVVDLKLTVEDRDVSDLHDNEFELTGERVGIFTGMDEHIVGMSEGETKEFTTTIPEDYANTELAGKEAHYTVTVKGVKYHELPELDDELAKSVGEYSSLDELKEAVRTQLTSQKETDARRELRDSAVKAVADEAKVEVHPVLVEDEIDAMMRETERMLQQSRISLEQYLEMTGKDQGEYRKEIAPDARERVRRDLVLDAVAEAEGITVSDEEMQSWLDLLTAMGGQRMQLRDLTPGQRANVSSRIRRDKATTRIVEIATEGHPEPIMGGAKAAAEAGEAIETGETTDGQAESVSRQDGSGTTKAGATSEAKGRQDGSDALEAGDVPSEAAMPEVEPEVPASTETDV